MKRRNMREARRCQNGELPVFVVVDIPTSTQLDGAVVELYVRDGVVAADVRIPAPEG